MDYLQALQKLRNHANMPGTNLPESESFLFALWQAGRQLRIPELEPLFDDIIACLEIVNRAVNTEHPSDNIAGKLEALPRSLVGDISFILSDGWHYYRRWSASKQFTESFRTQFGVMLVQLGIAWIAVLDGDIDDIRDHVRIEFQARHDLAFDTG